MVPPGKRKHILICNNFFARKFMNYQSLLDHMEIQSNLLLLICYKKKENCQSTKKFTSLKYVSSK